jgi:zinc protease
VASWTGLSGTRLDPPGKEGLSALTARLLNAGTRAWSKRALAQRLDRLAATISVETSWDHTSVEIAGPTAVEGELLAILSEVVSNPRFEAVEVERVKRSMQERIARDRSQPAPRAERAFLERLFPRSHPYHRSPSGTVRSIPRLTKGDLERFHRDHYTSGSSKIIVTSSTPEKEIVRTVRKNLPELRERSSSPSLPGRTGGGVRDPRRAPISIPIPGSRQVEVLMGGLAPTRRHPSYSALKLANEVLGGRPVLSRLFQVVREQSGLAYDTESEVNMLLNGGMWTVSAGTGAETVARVVERMGREVRRLATEEIPLQELTAMRESFIGSFLVHTDTPGSAHSFADEVAEYDLPLDHFLTWPTELRQITPREIRKSVADHLSDWEDPLVVIAGPPEGIPRPRGG